VFWRDAIPLPGLARHNRSGTITAGRVVELIAAWEWAGALVVFVVMDGDMGMDKPHEHVFDLFANHLDSTSRGGVVAHLERSHAEGKVPVLHGFRAAPGCTS
jgi:hypothetical protein